MYQGNWAKTLEKHENWAFVDEFYNLIVNELKEIIFSKT